MTKTEKKVIDRIPLPELIKETNKRAREVNATRGPYAALKKFVQCRDCGGEFGVRELRRHRSEARKLGHCPKKRKAA